MKRVKIVRIVSIRLCDQKPRQIRTLCDAKQIQCAIRLLLYYYCLVFCFCSSWKVKNVHLVFAELLHHKPTLHDFGIAVFFPKSPVVKVVL